MLNMNAEYAAKLRNEYMIIGHCTKYAVVIDENRNFYCVHDENNVLEPGTVCDTSELVALAEMPNLIQRAVALWYGMKEVM